MTAATALLVLHIRRFTAARNVFLLNAAVTLHSVMRRNSMSTSRRQRPQGALQRARAADELARQRSKCTHISCRVSPRGWRVADQTIRTGLALGRGAAKVLRTSA